MLFLPCKIRHEKSLPTSFQFDNCWVIYTLYVTRLERFTNGLFLTVPFITTANLSRLRICRCGEISRCESSPCVSADGSLRACPHKGGHVCMSECTCDNYERGRGLIMVETRGLTFQRDRWHTRLAHLRDFEL